MASSSDTPGDGQASRQGLSASEIARDWGTSRAYVSRCIHEKGCPQESLEAAREWRLKNSRYGIGYRSKGKPAPPAPQVGGESNPPAPAETSQAINQVTESDLTSLEDSLRAAIVVEQESLRLVREAQIGKEKGAVLESRLRAYNVACKNRSERESAVREEMERKRILVKLDEAKAIFGRGWQVVLPRLRAMGSQIGVRCNQANPMLAADTIDAAIAAILEEGEKSYAA